jgi:hypothetical protein
MAAPLPAVPQQRVSSGRCATPSGVPPDSAEELEIHKTAPGPLVPSNDETDTTARTSPSLSPVAPTLSSPNAPRPVPRPGPPVRRPDAGPARIVPKPGPAPRRPAAPQIEVQRIAAGPEAALDRADEFLDELLDAGRAPGQVLVLTTGGRHPWQQHEESFGAERYWAQLDEAQDVFYADVTGCRPVRREVVILVLNGGAPAVVERAEATARDHATSLLVVCGGAR